VCTTTEAGIGSCLQKGGVRAVRELGGVVPKESEYYERDKKEGWVVAKAREKGTLPRGRGQKRHEQKRTGLCSLIGN